MKISLQNKRHSHIDMALPYRTLDFFPITLTFSGILLKLVSFFKISSISASLSTSELNMMCLCLPAGWLSCVRVKLSSQTCQILATVIHKYLEDISMTRKEESTILLATLKTFQELGMHHFVYTQKKTVNVIRNCRI